MKKILLLAITALIACTAIWAKEKTQNKDTTEQTKEEIKEGLKEIGQGFAKVGNAIGKEAEKIGEAISDAFIEEKKTDSKKDKN